MYKRLICLTCLLVALGWAGGVHAALVAHWQLDEGAGATVYDASGNGYDGTILGDPTWVVGTDGGALQLDGRDDYVDFGNPADWPAGMAPRSLCGWGKTDTVAATYRWIAAYGSPITGQAMFIGLNGATLIAGGYGGDDVTVNNVWEVGEWFHVGLTYDGTVAKAYVNGREVGTLGKNWNLTLSRAHIGRQVNDAAEFWDGAVDDIRLYDHVLTAAEMKALVPPKLKARKGDPEDGATGIVSPLFQWTAGETARWHNVYLGTSAELTDADLVGVRLPFVMHWHLPGLEPGVTYYWRVDEIEADGVTTHTGDLWSFSTAPLKAYAPAPPDGARFQDLDVALIWTPGVSAKNHDVYFGTDATAVADGTGDTFKGNQTASLYEPEGLAPGTVYYWRVDEIEQDGTRRQGDVWRFTTLRDITVSDPNLVGWWTLDEGEGARVIDWSGHGIHGTFQGAPQWVPGAVDGALELDGDGAFIDFGNPADWPAGTSARSLCAWARTDTVAAGWRWIAAYGSPGTGQAMFIGINGANLFGGGYGDDVQRDGFWDVREWYHICLTYDGVTARLYANAVEVVSAAKTWDLVLSRAHIGRQVNDAVEFWDGAVDDVRLYDKVLTPEEIQLAMRGDPLRAWDPHPADESIADIRTAAPLTWSPGDRAVQHDVYLGTDVEAVDSANASDLSGIYRGSVSTASYAPPEGLLWGQSYAWRVDEINDDGSVTIGATWTFTVADYLIVDHFESYTDEVTGRIFQAWIDGWGYTEPPPGDPGNGTGATVGYLDPPFAEQQIVHSGKQSMPLDYNNIISPYYSETERTWATPQDFTVHDVTTLTLWVQGHAASPTVNETAPGAFTVAGEGADIWGTSDQFTFVHKTLSGNGSLIARVVSNGEGSNAWAKGGVMIRDSLAPGSAHAMQIITGGDGNGASFQWRPVFNEASVNSDAASPIAAPYWVKIERVGNSISGSLSPNGSTWTQQGLSQAVFMTDPVHIGLCVTSHVAGTDRIYEFDSVTTAGGVGGQWQARDIGLMRNDPATLYVALQDSTGRIKAVPHPDPGIVTVTDWTEWPIPLTAFGNVDMTRVKKMFIGVGDRDVPVPNGAGMLYIDDIRVIVPPEVQNGS